MRKELQAKTKCRLPLIKTFVILIAVIIHWDALAQNVTDSLRLRIKPGFFAGFVTGYSKNRIIINPAGSMAEMKSIQGSSYDGTIETGYFFSGGFGFSTGIGFSTSGQTFSLESYSNKYIATDSENDSYERHVSGSLISENHEITCLKIPFMINLRIPGRSVFSLYLSSGINLALPLTKKYTSTGIFTFSGYYPEFNVLLKDLPDYGFESDAIITASGEPVLRSYYIEGLASAGFQFLLARKFQLSLGAVYSRSMKSIGNYNNQASFQLATGTNEINSMLGGSFGSKTESMGVRLSLRYFFRGYRFISEPPRVQ